MMFHSDYRVKGADVDDYMAMESRAYFSYSLRHVYNFLFQMGYSREKLNKQQIHLLEERSHFELLKPLMFGESFTMLLKIQQHPSNNALFELKHSFFNANRELCALITSETKLKSPRGKETTRSITQKIMDYTHEKASISC